uniref:Homing endonuclease LAGLIDADG domain-containing protein n=1 Tax=Orbilia brochopaga TaxID=3140254 RepID=A0A4Y5MV50_9PEZI|nr:hypothetical protein [Drechslerella brochopaga]
MVTFPQIVDEFIGFTLYLINFVDLNLLSSISYINLPIKAYTNLNNINTKKLVTQNLSFDVFNELYHKKYNSKIDPNWLGWFVGFSEGDGYLGKKGDSGLTFVITQKELKILFEIKNTLKFGSVVEFEGFSRYIVQGKEEILLLYHIFNGNLHLLHRIDQLSVWGDWLNKKYINNSLNLITEPVKLSLDNSWFSGFIDAEGCFNVYIAKNANSVTLRFIVDQKDSLLLFQSLKMLLGSGSIYSRKNNNVRYTASKLMSLNIIINYLNKFALKSKKYFAFEKWSVIYNKKVNDEHKTTEGFLEIKRLSVLINKDND